MDNLLPDLIKKLFTPKNKKKKTNLPDNLFVQCPGCKQIIYRRKLDANLGVCPECGYHHRIPNKRWIEIICDKNSFVPLFDNLKTIDPLNFPKYREKVETLYQKNIDEGITTGKCKINGISTLIGIMNTEFMMGSMGSVVGERVTLLFERGIEKKLPVILFTRSGGARMQEGVISLMQMAKTSAAIKRFSNQGNLYITVLLDPTTGGVSASFAMLGDIILAEPKALIGFAGPRVIEQTIKQKLPEGFQRAEFLLEKGYIDKIINRHEMKTTLYKILKIHNYT